MKLRVSILLALVSATACAGPGSLGQTPPGSGFTHFTHSRGGTDPIGHIVVIMQENRSFNNLFHGFPGANTANSGMGHGKTYQLQEVPLKFPTDIPHSHTQFLEDFDQGQGDGFDNQIKKIKFDGACSDGINQPSCWVFYTSQARKQMAFSYVRLTDIQPYWTMAQEYALGDNAYSSNNGPTFPSHQYLIAGESGHASEVPSAQPWGCDGPKSGSTAETVEVLKYGQADPPVFSPSTGHEVTGPFPCFTYTTIADSLDAAGITWRYYVTAKGAGKNLSAFDAISKIRYGSDWSNVRSPDTKVLTDIANGDLQQVSWVMPTGLKSDHPGPGSGSGGPDWVASIVNAIGQSPYWSDTAIVVMWDEWGGWYDNVVPKQLHDPETKAYEGLGFRVPLIVISPYAKAGYISHKQHEIAGTLTLIEETFGLPKLGIGTHHKYADSRADGFDDMFDFTQKPIQFQPIPAKVKGKYFLDHPDNTPADTY